MALTKTLARAVFGGYFAFNGVHHFREMKGLKKYAKSKDVPCPELTLQGSGILLIASGLSLGLNIKPKLGAAGIVLFLATSNAKMHNFWTKRDLDRRYKELANFSKNLALIAATVAIGAAEAESKS
ncbi:MAG TPA: DoxX family membrane protein [Bryobacteraceae bacterium]|nr:DoxX family membrane protein [Bryobacteraceae bacterium]